MTIFNPDQVRGKLSELGKTQEDLARDIGVTIGTVNRWLNHKNIPLKAFQRRIWEILDEYKNQAA